MRSSKKIEAHIEDEVCILEGETFLVSLKNGDIPGEGAHGLFHKDTRFLSKSLLRFNEQELGVTSAKELEYFSAAFFLRNQNDDLAPAKSLSVIRRRAIEDALYEDICVENHNRFEVNLVVSLQYEVDFSDLFEVKSNNLRARQISHTVLPEQNSVSFVYTRDDFYRETRLTFSPPVELSTSRAIFKLTVPANGNIMLSMRVDMISEPNKNTPSKLIGVFDTVEHEDKKALQKWENHLPRLTSNNEIINRCFERSCIDMASLQVASPNLDSDAPLLAAGLPWYMTLIGRDTMIASYQSIILGSSMPERALRALAKKQANSVDEFLDEQPGKILHEVRQGEQSVFRSAPYSPYFGSIDSTLLFLILLSEVYRWTSKKELLIDLEDNARRALAWIEQYGDLDHDGYVEYKTTSSMGARNQGWKDSEDCILFFNGSLAEPSIAMCEVQGYLYDAYVRSSEIFQVLNDEKTADELLGKAKVLKQKFNRDFWSDSKNIFVLGLDRNKRQIDSVCSNMGQLLWSGIVESERAPALVSTLMSDGLYSGWGVRTMSAECLGFNPIGYHLGTVWPHDNSLIASGLMQYGFVEQAHRVMMDMLDAAAAFKYRLPETFAGYKRGKMTFPVRYPSSCSPQAWASGTPLLFVRTLLGLQPDVFNKTLLIEPHFPESLTDFSMECIPAFAKHFSIRGEGGRFEISQSCTCRKSG